MRSVALIQILDGIDRLAIDEEAKRQVRGLVSAVGLEHGVKRIECAKRVELARRLLDLGISRPTIRARVSAAFNVSPEQAYRDIRAALKLFQKTKQFAMKKDQTEASNGDLSLQTVLDGD